MKLRLEIYVKRLIDKIIPLYGILPLIACFATNMLVYCSAISVCKEWKHYNLTLPIDNMIPLSSGWMYIYWGAYLFWITNYVMMAYLHRDHKEVFYRFVTTDMMSRFVCGIFYFFMPTTNVRPEVVGTTFADMILRLLYEIDPPYNLFPSIHCLVSWMCYIGIRGNDKVPRWYRAFTCIFALLVVISTQTTKQHYIVDTVSGLLLAEVLYALNKHISLYRYVQDFFEKINHKLGLTNNREKNIE